MPLLIGPAPALTPLAILDQDALDEAQMDALYDWAYGVYGGLYPVQWRNQPSLQPTKPKITLNVTQVRQPGLTDDIRSSGEALVGARIGTVSVSVSTDPQPPLRALARAAGLVSGNYTLVVNGQAVTVNYGSAPASATIVATALLAELTVAGYSGFLFGLDPTGQWLAFENSDPNGALVVTAGSNMATSVYAPHKAMTLAQRMASSLGKQSVRDLLSAAGIGVGTVNDVNDLSAMLDTRAELRAQFDFFINLASTLAISGPIIDTVTSIDGTVTA